MVSSVVVERIRRDLTGEMVSGEMVSELCSETENIHGKEESW